MKKLVFLAMLISTTVYADDVVIYNTGDNSIVSFIQSVDVTPYSGCSDCVTFTLNSEEKTNRQLFLDTPMKYIRHDAGTIREMTAPEKSVVDTAVNAALDASMRSDAKAFYVGQTSQGQKDRCLAKILLDEINILRSDPLSILSARTLAQAKTAWNSCIDNGNVDE